ncbi:MAG: alpha/beta hydrolase domain-containing protein [Pseudomonadota bacterium]|nr:alpha/beta hydrolase domain-containing protein [Pseudomonadota bacterium]
MRLLLVTRFAAAILSGCSLCAPALAEVVRLDIHSTRPAFAGQRFGEVGAYEEIRATAHYRVDPAAPLNAGIANIQKAPRERDGRVAFDADVIIYRPVDAARTNRRMIYEMANRGRGLALGNTGSMPGDGFLMKQGYTLVVSGWQPDYPIAEAPVMSIAIGSRLSAGTGNTDLLMARLPLPRNSDGSPLTGVTREQFTSSGAGRPTFIGYLTYPAVDSSQKALINVREVWSAQGQTPPTLDYRYLDPWRVEITKPAGATEGALYEFVYTAKDPVIYGLGLAAMRDIVSFLRYDTTPANPLARNSSVPIDGVLAYGASQTGRVLKELVYEFTIDEKGRPLFEGAMAHISGAGRNSANVAFARPGIKDGGHTAWGVRGDDFPFSYPVTYDPLSRRTDGILARCVGDGSCPKIMHLDSEQELWQAGTLSFIDTTGRDLKMPDNVRIYAFAGTEHAAQPGGRTNCTIAESSTIPWRPFDRALLLALDEWAIKGRAPPRSSYPTVAAGTLVPLRDYAFPKLSQMPYSAPFAEKYFIDLGVQPPVRLQPYPALAPQVDADGNMLGGIRHPFMAAPLATNTGWNTRREGQGSGGMCGASGLSIAFAPTRAQRMAAGDPRLSVEERYKDEADYVKRVGAAADRLVRERLMLREDADAVKQEATRRYRAATQQ